MWRIPKIRKQHQRIIHNSYAYILYTRSIYFPLSYRIVAYLRLDTDLFVPLAGGITTGGHMPIVMMKSQQRDARNDGWYYKLMIKIMDEI